uniref:Uncharacterized protein n=1 Tax=Rhizophora mucronata TaxID=61149 RepID=A0A2P2IP39_RHIMU
MPSMAVQSPVNNISTYLLLFSQKFNPIMFKTPILLKPTAHRIDSSTVHGQKLRTISRKQRKSNTFAAPEALTAESESETIESEGAFSDQETEVYLPFYRLLIV